MEAREVLFRILLGHRLVGHDAKNPIEKICECGQRFVGLLAQDEHQRIEQEKVVAKLLLPAASPDALRVALEKLRQHWDDMADDPKCGSFDFRCALQRCEAELGLILKGASGAVVQVTGEQLQEEWYAVHTATGLNYLTTPATIWFAEYAKRLNAALSRQSQPPATKCQYCNRNIPRKLVGVHWVHQIGQEQFECYYHTLDVPAVPPLSKSVEKGRANE